MKHIEPIDEFGAIPNIWRPQDSQQIVGVAAGSIAIDQVVVRIADVPYVGHEPPIDYERREPDNFMAHLPA